jgi:radical SAM protein with 4Fe4S-binding SPASM domain
LTVDYYNVRFKFYKKKVERALVEIAIKELDFFKRHGYMLSNIFRNGRVVCSTGKHMLAINTNGDVFYCHGGIYSKCSKDLKYSNIFDNNFINRIEEVNEFIDNEFEPEECKQCISQSCLRCNVKKFEESKRNSFKDRWFDYTDQEQLCEYYRMVEKVGQALKDVINDK